jgi:hypothetical protein
LLLPLLLAAFPGSAVADTLAVGTFTKSTNTSVPVSQAIGHGLGETPKALIIWTMGKTSTTLGANARFGFGFSDMTTSRSVGCESDDGVSPSPAHRRMSDALVTLVDQAGVVRSEADLQSVDATNFTLRWTTNNSSAYIFHFIAIGGTHVSAKVINWTMRTSTGNQSITGVGFKPDVALHIHVGSGHTGGTPDTSQHAGFGLGAMDGQGNEWAFATFSTDATNPTDTSRYQRINRSLVSVGGSQTETKDASWVSMDSDGFTLGYSNANASAGQVASLALKGLQAYAGSFSKATGGATATQSVIGIPFRPRIVFLAGVQDVARTTGQAHARFGLGASDGTTEGAGAMQDMDDVGTGSIDGVSSTTKVFVKVNNSTPSTDAAADLTSLDAAGFTLGWTTNDAVATEMLYLALSTRRRIVVISRGPTAPLWLTADSPRRGSHAPHAATARRFWGLPVIVSRRKYSI